MILMSEKRCFQNLQILIEVRQGETPNVKTFCVSIFNQSSHISEVRRKLWADWKRLFKLEKMNQTVLSNG